MRKGEITPKSGGNSIRGGCEHDHYSYIAVRTEPNADSRCRTMENLIDGDAADPRIQFHRHTSDMGCQYQIVYADKVGSLARVQRLPVEHIFARSTPPLPTQPGSARPAVAALFAGHQNEPAKPRLLSVPAHTHGSRLSADYNPQSPGSPRLPPPPAKRRSSALRPCVLYSPCENCPLRSVCRGK